VPALQARIFSRQLFFLNPQFCSLQFFDLFPCDSSNPSEHLACLSSAFLLPGNSDSESSLSIVGFKMFLPILPLVFSVLACSVPGPVLKPEADSPSTIPGLKTGVITYSFQTGNGGYRDLRLGELVLMRKSSLRDRVSFSLRIVARNRAGSLRLKQYEGFVTRKDDILRLYSERCRIYGKKDFIDRMVPLEGWTCDHLMFQLRILPDGGLEKIQDNARETRDSDWLYLRRFTPLASHPAVAGRPVWAGQRLAAPDVFRGDLPVEAPQAKYGDETYPGGILTSDDGAVYFGYDAGRHLRPGDTITLFGEDRSTTQARVLHVIDDFVLVQNAAKKAPVAGTMKTRAPKGLFD
jgi:hypothetical protein